MSCLFYLIIFLTALLARKAETGDSISNPPSLCEFPQTKAIDATTTEYLSNPPCGKHHIFNEKLFGNRCASTHTECLKLRPKENSAINFQGVRSIINKPYGNRSWSGSGPSIKQGKTGSVSPPIQKLTTRGASLDNLQPHERLAKTAHLHLKPSNNIPVRWNPEHPFLREDKTPPNGRNSHPVDAEDLRDRLSSLKFYQDEQEQKEILAQAQRERERKRWENYEKARREREERNNRAQLAKAQRAREEEEANRLRLAKAESLKQPQRTQSWNRYSPEQGRIQQPAANSWKPFFTSPERSNQSPFDLWRSPGARVTSGFLGPPWTADRASLVQMFLKQMEDRKKLLAANGNAMFQNSPMPGLVAGAPQFQGFGGYSFNRRFK